MLVTFRQVRQFLGIQTNTILIKTDKLELGCLSQALVVSVVLTAFRALHASVVLIAAVAVAEDAEVVAVEDAEVAVVEDAVAVAAVDNSSVTMKTVLPIKSPCLIRRGFSIIFCSQD